MESQWHPQLNPRDAQPGQEGGENILRKPKFSANCIPMTPTTSLTPMVANTDASTLPPAFCPETQVFPGVCLLFLGFGVVDARAHDQLHPRWAFGKSFYRSTASPDRAYPTLVFAFIRVRGVWSHMDVISG